MTISHRASIIAKTHRVLKKHYKPVVPDTERSLLECLLYAHCLENAKYDKADEAFQRLKSSFFDWNEVRVTTVSELAEVIQDLPDPSSTAANIKRTLQSVFESYYSYDLDNLKKQNIGKTVKQLLKYPGVTPFATAYITQHALGGHAIPIDQGAWKIMHIVGVLDDADQVKGTVPGLERAIPKKKGVEFASLLHQVAADLYTTPHLAATRSILLEIAPDAQPRLPKRASRKSALKEVDDHPKTTAKADRKTSKKTLDADAASTKKHVKTASKKKAPLKKASKSDSVKKKPTSKKKLASKQLAKRKPR